jgi:hypothetical protein
MPPIVELDMLINLYFPDLKSEQKKLMDAIHKYGKSSLEARHTDYKKSTLAEKQNMSGALYNMQNTIESEIKSMQACLAKRVKS